MVTLWFPPSCGDSVVDWILAEISLEMSFCGYHHVVATFCVDSMESWGNDVVSMESPQKVKATWW